MRPIAAVAVELREICSSDRKNLGKYALFS
jgi:hypothetical protein